MTGDAVAGDRLPVGGGGGIADTLDGYRAARVERASHIGELHLARNPRKRGTGLGDVFQPALAKLRHPSRRRHLDTLLR